jgi:hypothetical protein
MGDLNIILGNKGRTGSSLDFKSLHESKIKNHINNNNNDDKY